MEHRYNPSAYGGPRWSRRNTLLLEEIGKLWGSCGVDTEWSPLKSILLHKPGEELETIKDPDKVQMLMLPEPYKARKQHDELARAYLDEGIKVHYVNPLQTPSPNQMFVADLLFMTPEGAILSRPASTVRAGEEIHVARRLAELKIPILRTVRGGGTFEGADAMWINPDRVLVGRGHRTNLKGASQVASTLEEMDKDVVQVDLPVGTMHLMGTLRIADKDLAISWPTRTPYKAVETLKEEGYDVLFIPDQSEAQKGMSLNFVTVAPRRILMSEGNDITRNFYEDTGIKCKTIKIDELIKAAGGIGCLTGILERAKP
jgi:N-dimethylarginine dimethylaminohydrolase